MWKSMFYKEWIKVRLASILSLAVGTVAILGIYLNVRHTFIITNAHEFWDGIINQRHIYFKLFKYIPLGIGILIGLSQFLPEVKDKRIKLTLHLPLNEEKAGLKMVAFGLTCLLTLYSILSALLILPGRYYFPYEVVALSANTIIPWFSAGLAAYFITGLITIEPLWKYKVFYTLLGFAFINLFYQSDLAGAYQYAWLPFLGIISLVSISILFSIYRFRKGEM
ncbi:hypothetical protein [Maribellus luteus]|uniref:hypothetical protein n=1 Tax=Maribellus luteus TaxID=2305463 RepID=UPI00138FAD67|nr:hypothetical protein [Maribellus luteus]